MSCTREEHEPQIDAKMLKKKNKERGIVHQNTLYAFLTTPKLNVWHSSHGWYYFSCRGSPEVHTALVACSMEQDPKRE